MRDLLLLAVQLVVTLAKFMRPGGVRSVIAESLLVKHQLIISGRSRRRAPPLTTIDRFVLGFMVLFLRPPRVAKLAAVLKPATLLRFHKALVDRKYRLLFSSSHHCKPGPKGPFPRAHRGHRRHEAAQSVFRLQANRPTARAPAFPNLAQTSALPKYSQQ